MKKTFLIGVLAALMLFAFTACEQTPNSPLYGAQVENITVVSQPDIVIDDSGLIVAASDAELVLQVNYNDGSSIQYNQSQLDITSATGNYGSYVGCDVKVPGSTNTFLVLLKTYEAEGYTFDLSSLDAVEIYAGNDAEALSLAKLAASVTYDGSKSLEATSPLSSSSITAETVKEDIIKDNNLAIGGTYTVNAENFGDLMGWAANGDERTEYTITGTWTLTVAEKKDYVTAVAKQGHELFAVGSYNNFAAAQVVIELTDENGNVRTIGSSTSNADDKTWSITTDQITSSYTFDEVRDYEIVVKATKSGEKTITAPLTLKVIEDYPISFAATQKDKTDAAGTGKYQYTAGEDVIMSQFEFTAEWASGYKQYNNTDEDDTNDAPATFDYSDFTAVPEKIREGVGKGSYTVDFSYNADSKIPVTGATVTIKDAE